MTSLANSQGEATRRMVGTGESLSCPLCGGLDIAYYATHRKAGQNLYRCLDCTFYFVFPHESFIPSLSDGTEDPSQFRFWASPAAERAYVRWRENENLRIAQLILKELDHMRRIRLLEVGFGDGPLTEILLTEVDEYWGIEPIPAAFEKTVSRLGLDRSKCRPIRAEELESDPAFSKEIGTFDVIVMVSVFEHLPNPGLILRTCARLLRSGGVLIISTPDSKYFRQLRALRMVARMEPWSHHHISFFNEGNLEKAFYSHGFSVKERTFGRLVTPESVRYFRELTNSRGVEVAMSAFMKTGLDRAFRIQTLFYVLEKQP